MEIVLIDSNQKEPMIDHFKAKLQSQKLRNFLLQYLNFPRTLIRALRQGFHKLMHSSLVIVTLGHGPFFSESADASVRLSDLASFLLHHPSDRRVLLTKKGYPFKICHPNQLGLH